MTDARTEAVLSINELRFGYESHTAVIDGITAELMPGQLCVMIGPNAAGKSTLLRLMLGLHEPWSGSVTLCSQDASGIPPMQRAAMMSYVPQHSVINFSFTVQQVLTMGRFALGHDAHAIEHAIEMCDLKKLRQRPYNELSTGQQQRVLLARAVVQSTGGGRLMLMDEPGSGMDLRHVHEMMRMLQRLSRSGLAVLVVLHDLNLAARYADNVWLLDDGKLAATGTWDQVLKPHVLQPVYGVELATLQHRELNRPVFTVTTVAD